MHLKNILTFIVMLMAFYTKAYSIILLDIDPTQLDIQTQASLINVYKANTWPTAAVRTFRGDMIQEDSEALNALIQLDESFSSTQLFHTLEAEFLKNQIEQKLQLKVNTLQIPSTLWDLEMIKLFFSDTDFCADCEKHTCNGRLNQLGTEEEKSAWCDRNFLQRSHELYALYSQFTSEEDVASYAEKLIASVASPYINDFDQSYDSSPALQRQNSINILKYIIQQEIKEQAKGAVSLYRASGGFIYKEEPDNHGPCLSEHPGIQQEHDSYVETLNFFVSAQYANSFGISANEIPTGSTAEKLKFYSKYRHITENSNCLMTKVLDQVYRSLTSAYHILDYPFQPATSNSTILTVGSEILSGNLYPMSFSYSVLGGYLFDGYSAQKSACSFVFATKAADPYLYALPIRLVDIYRGKGNFIYSNFFTYPPTPLYQSVFDSGEGFHPRLKSCIFDQWSPYTFMGLKDEEKPGVLYEYSKLMLEESKVLAFARTSAGEDTNVPFVQALKARNLEVLDQIRKVLEVQPMIVNLYETVNYHIGDTDEDLPFALMKGFSGAEGSHRWTDGDEAIIEIPSQQKEGRITKVTFRGTKALVTSHHKQELYVFLNNQFVQNYRYESSEQSHDISVDWPVNLHRIMLGSPAKLEFSIPYAEAPNVLYPGSLDPRKLGIAFDSVDVVFEKPNHQTFHMGDQEDGLPFSISGFSGGEGTHRWTLGHKAIVSLPVLQGNSQFYKLTFKDTGALISDTYEQKLTVCGKGIAKREYVYNQNTSRHTIEVDVSAFIKGTAEIHFNIPNACLPCVIDPKNVDGRELAIAFGSVEMAFFNLPSETL